MGVLTPSLPTFQTTKGQFREDQIRKADLNRSTCLVRLIRWVSILIKDKLGVVEARLVILSPYDNDASSSGGQQRPAPGKS